MVNVPITVKLSKPQNKASHDWFLASACVDRYGRVQRNWRCFCHIFFSLLESRLREQDDLFSEFELRCIYFKSLGAQQQSLVHDHVIENRIDAFYVHNVILPAP